MLTSAPGAAARDRQVPSGYLYLATIGIFVASLVVGAGMIAHGVRTSRTTTEDATRVEPGTTATLTFLRPQSFTIYYLGPSQVFGPGDVAAFTQRIDPQIRPAAGGTALAIHPYSGSASVLHSTHFAGQQQIALGTFHVDHPGNYLITSRQLEGVSADEDQLIVTPSPFRAVGHWAAIAGVVAASGFALALIASLALGASRKRARRGLGGAGGPVPGGGPAGWPPAATPWSDGSVPGWAGGRTVIPPPPPGYGGRPPDR